MQNAMWITTIVLLLGNLGFLVFILKRLAAKDKTQDALLALRELVANLEKAIRDEVRASQVTTANTLTVQLQSTADTLVGAVGKLGDAQSLHLEGVIKSIETTVNTLVTTVGELGETQTHELANVTKSVNNLTQTNETRIENVRNTLNEGLQALQTSNENKLEQMRQTVDEQLQSTLEKRIGESFKLVSTHLEAVQQGLGEMQNLATGVGDLKKVLTNVRARGTWGEVQLGAILEQVLAPGQYDTNVRIKENSHVEFAICLPGSDDQPDSCLWLPIDSKFPTADYQRLLDATDVKTEKALTKKFINSVESEARKIGDKYIEPPVTTDFAIMFLPTEGLYAEVLRQPGQVEKLQTEYRIVVAGPTTLTAILSSLRLGFRTLAIQKHSSEVWKLLTAVKTEFGKFADVLDTLKKQLNTAYNTIDVDTGRRVRAIHNKLQTVEELPLETAAAEFGIPNEGQIDKGDADE